MNADSMLDVAQWAGELRISYVEKLGKPRSRHTWLELVVVLPVEGDVLDGVVGDPHLCPSRNVQAAGQCDVMNVAHPQLPNAYRWVHTQHLLQRQNKAFELLRARKVLHAAYHSLSAK